GCGFVDSMFYDVILPQKRAVKERLGLKFVCGFAHFTEDGGLSGGGRQYRNRTRQSIFNEKFPQTAMECGNFFIINI
ncbi:MAG TPA: hypothetical protein PLB18_23730, partial [Acidobacteriota bacterium]|nr:hypothetical protein [Acidobacteriota bacterium]